MLAVALTCPLWWVARWAARLLTGLAVAVAFAVGAGALPAVSAQAGVPSTDTWAPPAHTWAPPAPALPVTLAPADPPVVVADHRVVAADRAATGPGHPAAPADPGAAAGAVTVGPVPAPAGHTPGTVGPRGPPHV
ncbi:hypothetical protein [Micromonospora sp. NPDC002717]|uniref:hypothetical protein n=1 Tax=Micromonospora sp. NPDC002717 TaxID=3154424 RepID=UPI00332EF33B